MNKTALAKLFYREAEKLREGELAEGKLAESAYKLINLLFVEMTKAEKLQFTTLFSRIAYVSQQHALSRQLQYFIHTFRKGISQGISQEDRSVYDQLGLKVLIQSVEAFFQEPIPSSLLDIAQAAWSLPFSKVNVKSFQAEARVVALADIPEEKCLLIKDESTPEGEFKLQYDIPDRNENFNSTIDLIRHQFGFPVVLQLLDVEIDQEHHYRPRAIVVEPDYLMDVSGIAECFKPSGTIPELSLIKKYLPFETSRPLILGNIANFFLDELMRNPEADYRQTFIQVFRLFPLTFSLLEDAEIRSIMQMAQKHFVNLKKVIHVDLPSTKVDLKHCYLEPSFYAPNYGIQGRLDVLALGEQKAIIELKSGKVYRPNVYGLSVNHYTQTLLYDLIIRAVYGNKTNPVNYILYSGTDDNHLRFAPVVKSQQFEAINVRNHMLAIERQLAGLGCNDLLGQEGWLHDANALFQKIRIQHFPQVKGFVQRDMIAFSDFYDRLGSLEKRYFVAFSGLIAREHRLAKIGQDLSDRSNGQAALWLSSMQEKEDGFHILAQLELQEQQVMSKEPLLRFKRGPQTNPLANFRSGDIAVLYPYREKDSNPVHNQIFKCTVMDINKEEVLVRLRSAQFNDDLFQEYPNWNLEHDLLDSGFTNMYRNLYSFLNSAQRKQKLILGTIAPSPASTEPLEVDVPEFTAEQHSIFQKLLHSKDYFLLWGPPGTGKTSIMLKNLTGYLMENTQENILLLAYTNRAVDEMCEAIEHFHPDMHRAYLRIGSRFSTAPKYRDRLLTVQSEKIETRKELKGMIRSYRLFVGTVASVSGKPELFKLKKFQRVIIDEASQILEPMLVGILPLFDHFTLIGDHKQLPAVVVQDEKISAVEDDYLQRIGLSNLRNSLFERLYKLCVSESWDHAYAQLSHQGRMHQDIMQFPNEHFYQGLLHILPSYVGHHQQQVAPIPFQTTESGGLLQLISQQRLLFLAVQSDTIAGQQKTNRAEAQMVAKLLFKFQELFSQNNKDFSLEQVGIITPYRAQIAMIREVLTQEEIPLEKLTIDTVERYQGGARNIIIISLCTNSLNQLDSMISLSEEGVDRKLNVALTRAREYLVLLGNPDLLKTNPIYSKLLDYCRELAKLA